MTCSKSDRLKLLPVSAGCSLARLNDGFRITETPTDPAHRHQGEQVKHSLHRRDPCWFGLNKSTSKEDPGKLGSQRCAE